MSTWHRAALIAWLALPASAPADDFHRAIQDGNLTKVKELLAKDPKLATTSDKNGWTPLRLAVIYGYPAIGDALVAAGAKLDIESASALGKTREVAAMLKEKPWLAKPPRKPLIHAAGRGYLEIVKLLLKHGADPNLPDVSSGNRYSATALRGAVVSGHYEIAKLLCEHGAKVDWAFYTAVMSADARFVKLLLEHKADANETINAGLTLLHLTAWLGTNRQDQAAAGLQGGRQLPDGRRSDAPVLRRGSRTPRVLRSSPEARRPAGRVFCLCARQDTGSNRPSEGQSHAGQDEGQAAPAHSPLLGRPEWRREACGAAALPGRRCQSSRSRLLRRVRGRAHG